MEKTLYIRADAGGRMGTGHIMRMLALGQAWRARGGVVKIVVCQCPEAIKCRVADEGFSIHYISGEPGSDADLAALVDFIEHDPLAVVAIDGYQFASEYLAEVHGRCRNVMVVDDFAHLGEYPASIILNQNLGADKLGLQERCARGRFLLGTKYVLLREEFSHPLAEPPGIPERARRILVTMGGTDPDRVTIRVLRALEELKTLDLDVRILVGGGNLAEEEIRHLATESSFPCEVVVNVANMPQHIQWAHLAVTAGGSTCWELAYLGVPMLAISLAENQNGIVHGLDRAGAAHSLGWHDELDMRSMPSVLQTIMEDAGRRIAMSKAGRRLVDGHGARRVAGAMEGALDICVASSRDTWMNDYLTPWLNVLGDSGHRVRFVHRAGDIMPSDITFLLSFEDVVTPDVLSRSAHNIVVHASDLPRGRGWSPLSWQILEGEHVIPLTLFEAEEAVDSGDIYLSGEIHLEGNELIKETRAPLASEVIRLCQTFVDNYPFIVCEGRPQTGEVSYYPRRRPADSRLDLDRPLREQLKLLRVVDNDRYPAFFDYAGHRFELHVIKRPAES